MQTNPEQAMALNSGNMAVKSVGVIIAVIPLNSSGIGGARGQCKLPRYDQRACRARCPVCGTTARAPCRPAGGARGEAVTEVPGYVSPTFPVWGFQV